MSDDQFTLLSTQITEVVKQVDTLAVAMTKGFADVQAQLDTKASGADMHHAIDMMAGIAKQYADHEEDHHMTDSAMQRLDHKLNELAQHVGYTFKAE